jgi:hypothetical protein
MDHDAESNRSRRPSVPPFQLRFGAIFVRVALITLVVAEVVLWLKLRDAGFPFRPRYRRFLVMLYFTPKLAFRAMALAAAVTVVSDLVFRLLVRPLMQRWYDPRPRDPHWTHPHPFFMKAREVVLDEMAARAVTAGRSRPPGTLVVTDCGLYFYPYAWNAEPWTLPIGHLRSVSLRTPRRRVLGFVEGYPDNVVFTDDSGAEAAFVVADPAALLSRFGRPAIPAPHPAV